MNMTCLSAFCYLPALQTKLFFVHGARRRDGSLLRSKDFANTQALQPSARTKSRHSPRAGSPESRQASQMSFRGEYDGAASGSCLRELLHTLAPSKTNTSTSHCRQPGASIVHHSQAARGASITPDICHGHHGDAKQRARCRLGGAKVRERKKL